MLRKRAHQRLIAWLAIAAMGLLALVPTVSRVLVSPTAAPVMAMSMEMAMGADCPEQHASQDHPHAPPDSGQPPSTDACGYCSLISHSPALMAAALVLPPALPTAPLSIMHVAPEAPSVAPLDVHSRGPPLV